MAMKKSMKRSATPKPSTSKAKKPAASKAAPAPKKMKRKSSTGSKVEEFKDEVVSTLQKHLGKYGTYATAVLAVIFVVLVWFAIVLDSKMVASKLPGAVGDSYLSLATTIDGGLHAASTSVQTGFKGVVGKLGALSASIGVVGKAPQPAAAAAKPAAAKPAEPKAVPVQEGGAPPQQ